MTLPTRNASHKANPTSVVLMRRMVETLRRRQAVFLVQVGHNWLSVFHGLNCLPNQVFQATERRARGLGTDTSTPISTAWQRAKYNSEFRYRSCEFQNRNF